MRNGENHEFTKLAKASTARPSADTDYLCKVRQGFCNEGTAKETYLPKAEERKEAMNKNVIIFLQAVVILALILVAAAGYNPNLIDRRYYDGVTIYEDVERDVTCWIYGRLDDGAIHCIPNNQLE